MGARCIGGSIMWGVYECEDSVHIIPCDKEGIMYNPHIIDDFCLCRPEALDWGEDGRLILNHHELH